MKPTPVYMFLSIGFWFWSNTFGATIAADSFPNTLPNTVPINEVLSSDEMFAKMMMGAHKWIDQKILDSKNQREKYWNRNFESQSSYDQSVEVNRKRFMHYIGMQDNIQTGRNYNIGIPDKHPPVKMYRISEKQNTIIVSETEHYRILQVQWPVLDGVNGEGLLIEPKTKVKATVISIPDADQTPEQMVGLSPGIPDDSQFARHLAENGFQVLIPVLINRDTIFFESNGFQTRREWLYRQAFHMGRHIIGYEVQKILSAVDWFKKEENTTKIGVAGYGEGGLIAFYSAAVDTRIDAVMVSGYFNNRDAFWKEPIYRNVWGLLTEFGDAEIAGLVAPRPMIIEYSEVPSALKPSLEDFEPLITTKYTGFKGGEVTPHFRSVQLEFNRINEIIPENFQTRILIHNQGSVLPFGCMATLEKFTKILGFDKFLNPTSVLPHDRRSSYDVEERQYRQFKEIERHVQKLLRLSDRKRNDFYLYEVMPEFANRKWNTDSYIPYFSPESFIKESTKFREFFCDEILGSFKDELLPPNPQSRKIYDTERWVGYEVVLDVFDDFIAPGILLLPKDLREGEKRPVVVIQHGRNGVPGIVIEGNTSYYDIGSQLVTQGFIVFAPYGLFKGEDQYRWLDRKANGLKKTLFSFIVSQHEQILKWLQSLAFVDNNRIAFYGKSYGGETAMRIPAVLEGYALSICSADFGDWTRKVVDVYSPYSFMKSIEWEMPYFNMGSTFSYAEMAYLIFPRPFMVERGHHDLVQPDEWVLYEYGKVFFLYDQFNKGHMTKIEIFNGGHASRNDGTFQFLRKHLNWP